MNSLFLFDFGGYRDFCHKNVTFFLFFCHFYILCLFTSRTTKIDVVILLSKNSKALIQR